VESLREIDTHGVPFYNAPPRRTSIMLISELTLKFPPVCTEHTALDQVYSLLSGSPDRMVVVIDGEAHRVPIGVITERSICEQILGRRRDPRSLSAANVINCDIVKVEAERDLRDAPRIFGTNKPVVVIDQDRRFVGVADVSNLVPVSQADPVDFVPANTVSHVNTPPILGLA
jgi:CBS domain-containing protein